MSGRTWSAQQEAIFAWFEHGKGNMIARARAGTGKTTTIIEGVNRAPEARILLCAFNKKIADELVTRLRNPAAEAKTLHSIGFAAVRAAWPGVRVAKGEDRAQYLTGSVCDGNVPDAIKKLVTKLHTKGREITPHADNLGDLTDLIWQFDLVPDDSRGARRAKREEKVDQIVDQADMLRNLATDAVNIDAIGVRIDVLFTDDGLGQAGVITCSSVHRAKGLEANRVFILASTLRNHSIEEQNIRYVAITRAKRELTWVA